MEMVTQIWQKRFILYGNEKKCSFSAKPASEKKVEAEMKQI
jgi:hypothetical protein